jgi:hypothetical protein
MSATGYYDPEMQMFIEPDHPLDLRVLEFYRWLIEHERLVIRTPEGEKED